MENRKTFIERELFAIHREIMSTLSGWPSVEHPAGGHELERMASATLRLRDEIGAERRRHRDDAHKIQSLANELKQSRGRCRELDGDVDRFVDRVMGILIDLHAEITGSRGEYRFPK